MILLRRFECLGFLLKNNPKSKEAFYSAFSCDTPIEQIDSLAEGNSWLALHNAGMGCCIPGDAYIKIMDRFAELDITDPYDNGCTYQDVNRIDHVSSKSGKEISLIFKNVFDGMERIVQVVSIRTEDGVTRIAEPWDPKIFGKGI